jgi:hypothetical protein
MARGKPWSDAETGVLMEMVAQGMSPQQIYDSGRLPGRTYQAIVKELYDYGTIVKACRSAIVNTIEAAPNALTMDEVVKLFTTAFIDICNSKEVSKLALDRFRIIFQAAKHYGPLLASYEKWEKIEKQIEALAVSVAELKAAKESKEASRA